MRKITGKTPEKVVYGQLLRNIRSAIGMSPRELAALTGIPVWKEDGEMPGFEAILTLAVAGANKRTILAVTKAAITAHGGIFIPACPGASKTVAGLIDECLEEYSDLYEKAAHEREEAQQRITDQQMASGEQRAALVRKINRVVGSTKKTRRWKELGEKLFQHRRATGNTSLDVAEALGTTVAVIDRLETIGHPGRVDDPDALKARIEEFVSRSET